MQILEKLPNGCPYILTHNEATGLKVNDPLNKFHVLHLNIRSALKNCDKLLLLLDELLVHDISIDVIVLCETFLTDVSQCMFTVPGYRCFFKNRQNRPGGGIAILVKNEIEFLEEFTTPFNECTESYFIKIKVGQVSMVCGSLYRIPNTNLDTFAADYVEIFKLMEKYKYVIIRSDHNLDFVKRHVHTPTSDFIENLLHFGYAVTINKATRVTMQSGNIYRQYLLQGFYNV